MLDKIFEPKTGTNESINYFIIRIIFWEVDENHPCIL